MHIKLNTNKPPLRPKSALFTLYPLTFLSWPTYNKWIIGEWLTNCNSSTVECLVDPPITTIWMRLHCQYDHDHVISFGRILIDCILWIWAIDDVNHYLLCSMASLCSVVCAVNSCRRKWLTILLVLPEQYISLLLLICYPLCIQATLVNTLNSEVSLLSPNSTWFYQFWQGETGKESTSYSY